MTKGFPFSFPVFTFITQKIRKSTAIPRWPFVEFVLLKHITDEMSNNKTPYRSPAAYAITYAAGLNISSWPELEEQLGKDPTHPATSKYIADIRGGVWPELDDQILQSLQHNPKMLYEYIAFTRRMPWEEAEPILQKDPKVWRKYTAAFDLPDPAFDVSTNTPQQALELVNQRGSRPAAELESKILKHLQSAIDYAKNTRGPWPELEQEILRKGTPNDAFEYAFKVLHDEWLDGEELIKKDKQLWNSYVERMKHEAIDLPFEQ